MKQVLSSDVDSDDEAVHTKARHVLRRLQSGQYDRYFQNDVYRCPFCTTRNLRSTEFKAVVTHAEAVKTSCPNVGETVNRYAYTAKHIALGIHLRNLQQVAIAGDACSRSSSRCASQRATSSRSACGRRTRRRRPGGGVEGVLLLMCAAAVKQQFMFYVYICGVLAAERSV